MNNMLKMVGTYVIVGAAGAAGATLWNDVLKEKTYELSDNLKKKKEQKNKIIKFKKR